LLNNIFPSYSTKHRWGMINSANCHICNEVEPYEQVFIDYLAENSVWELVSECFLTYGITQPTCIWTLSHVLDYLISYHEYVFVNLIFLILWFSIYKSYFLSDNSSYCDLSRFVIKRISLFCFLFYGIKNG